MLLVGRADAESLTGARARAIQTDADALGLDRNALPPRVVTSLTLRSSIADPVDRSWRTLAEHPALTLLPASDLEFLVHKSTPRHDHVRFRQLVQGLPVLQSGVELRWTGTGRLALVRSRVYLDTDGNTLDAPRTNWGSPDAAFASATLGQGDPSPRLVSQEQAWLPILEDGATRLRGVWRVHFRTEEPPGDWEVWVDAETGELRFSENRIVSAVLEGTVYGDIEFGLPGDGDERVALPHAFVSLERDGDAIRGESDTRGHYRFEGVDAAPVRRRVELRGPAVWVRDSGRELRTPFDTLTVSPGAPDEAVFSSRNASASARDAFFHATLAWAYTRALDPSDGMAELDSTLELRVDDPRGACNAYWRGDYFNFFAAGSGCAATARIADVVYHEYAHAATQYAYAPLPIPSDVNEGLSDYFAASLTNQPRIGRGFRGSSSFLREIETDRVFPEDAHPDPHLQGLILAGALWDLRGVLGQAKTDSLFHYARYGAAASMHDYLLDVLLYDDRDGDLENGTPHFREIIGAFRRHGVGDYSVSIEAESLPDREILIGPIEARATIRSLLGLEPSAVGLFYSVDDGLSFVPASLEPTDVAREFRARIPEPPSGTRVRYYWAAADTVGTPALSPPGAPAETYSFYVGPDLLAPEIQHRPVEAITTDLGVLSLIARVDDNSHRLSVVRADAEQVGFDRFSALLNPRVDLGDWRAELRLPALLPGQSLRYRIAATDSALVPNQATLPIDGEFELAVRAGSSTAFEDSEGPLASPSTGDWEWGAAPATLGAPSGERIWATQLAGPYHDNLLSDLVFAIPIAKTLSRARLEFDHHYQFERRYDGGRVYASTDAGASWKLLHPDGGYPERAVAIWNGPAFSGRNEGWEHVVVPLDAALGHELWIRFAAASDPYVNDLGWYLDNLTVIEAQARSAPTAFRARGGEDRRVELLWSPPASIDLDSPRFLGYVLHRAASDGPFDEAPLHPEPIRDTRYVDLAVENGTRYRYRLQCRYDEGSSIALEDDATPYAASIALDVERIEFELRNQVASDTTFFVRNESGGNLRFQAFLADSGQSLDATRIRWTRGEEWLPGRELLALDPADAGNHPDLALLALAVDLDPELGPTLSFHMKGHERWGDPTRDWGGILLMDTDGNLDTSQGTFTFGYGEERNLGWEYGVLFGKLALDQGSPAPALLFQPRGVGTTPVDRNHFPINADSLSFSIPATLLGDPRSLQMAVYLTESREELPFDSAPETPRLRWLDREPRSGVVLADRPQPFSVNFDARPVGNGIFHATLFLETNDPNHPQLEVPVKLTVSGYVPTELADLSLISEPGGMAIAFRVPRELDAHVATIERANVDDRVWGRVGPDSLFPDAAGRFEHIDPSVEMSVPYLYRFRVAFHGSPPRTYGPFEARYAPSVPPRLSLWPAWPNPAVSGCELRLELPAAGRVRAEIFDVQGRRRRVLLDGARAAGYHRLIWDTRDSEGRHVSAGRYWVSVRTADGNTRGTIVVLR